MKITPKTKQKIYLYIEKEHGWISTCILQIVISVSLILLRTPKSLNRIVSKEIRAGDFKTPIRRLNWLLGYSAINVQIFDDDFFDFSLGLNHDASVDMVQKLNSYKNKAFKDYVHTAQLSSRVIESQLSPGQSIQIKDLKFAQQYDQQYQKQLALALQSIRLNSHSDLSNVTETTTPKVDSREAVKSSDAFMQNTLAHEVFCDVVDFMEIHLPKMYSVSGTLLGIIRENKLLSHDIDIDIGVMEEDIDADSLVKAIQESENLYLKKLDFPVLRNNVNGEVVYSRMVMPSLIKFGHKKGLHIDLFIHFKDGNVRWHGSSLHRWDNSDFEIESIKFLGKNINIPTNSERYLEENYGDWKTPKIDFNCSIDTPNIALQNSCKTVCYFIKLLNFYRADAAISRRILGLLNQQSIIIPPNLNQAYTEDGSQ